MIGCVFDTIVFLFYNVFFNLTKGASAMNRISFLHVRNLRSGVVDPRGGETFAYREIAPNRIEYAVARCSNKDNFVKAYGRNAAAGRLASPTHRRVYEGTLEQFKDVVFAE